MQTEPQNNPDHIHPLPGTEPPLVTSVADPGLDPATDGEIRDGVEEQRRVVKDGSIAVKARVEERQATEIPAMRYVLGIGVGLAIIGMFLAWLFLH